LGEDGRIVYRVVIDDNGVESEAANAGQRVGGALEKSARGGTSAFEQLMIGAARKIGAAFVEMAAKGVQSVEQIVQAGIDFNAKMETYQTAFTTLLGSAEEAAEVMERIRKDAASTPFDVDSLTQANQMLISAGVSAEAARDQVLNLANAVSATGGGSAELSRMAANLQQIRNVGKATAMDIRQFANAGINIYGLLADSMGVTTEQAAEMEITYDQLAEAFEKAATSGGMYAGALEAQSKTFTGQISTLKDNLTQLSGVLTEDIFNALAEDALPRVIGWVNELLEAAEENGIAGVLDVVSKIFHEMMDAFNEHMPEIADVGFTIVQTLLNALLEIIKELPRTVVNIVTSLVGAFLDHLPEMIVTGIEMITALFEGIATAIPDLIASIPTLCEKMIQAFKDVNWASVGIQITDAIWSGLAASWELAPAAWIAKKVKSLFKGAKDGAKDELGISSPSKEFEYIGRMCIEGAELGFENNEAELMRTVKTTFEGVPSTAALSSGLNPNVGNSIATNISHSMTSNVTGGNVFNITLDAHNVDDFTRIVDLVDSMGVRARMA
jgi:tape measure domain-containing protein